VTDRWISNASPLIVLVRSGHLDLLRALPPPVLVPAAVLSELEAGDASDGAADAVRALDFVARVGDVDVPDTIASWRLDAGESQVLAHSAARSGAGVLLDDRAARRCARTLGIPVLGTIGLIVRAKGAGIVPAAGPVIKAVVDAGLYVDEVLVSAVLADSGKSGEARRKRAAPGAPTSPAAQTWRRRSRRTR
jgi:predicted nucleic acid-binding protein